MIPPKVAHLIRLSQAAGSDAEASAAARQACRLLLDVVGLDSQQTSSREQERSTMDRDTIARLRSELADTEARLKSARKTIAMQMESQIRDAARRPSEATYKDRATGETSDNPETLLLKRKNRDLNEQVQKLKTELENLKEPPRVIVAKFNSHCRECGELTHAGEKVWWQPGIKGAVCSECHSD